MSEPDRRLHAFRPDLADAALEGRVEAERFTAGRPAVLRVGAADLRRAPDPAVGIDTQLLFGEDVTVFEVKDGWAWVQNHRDGYVGYLAADALGEPVGEATHQVAATRTFVYPAPDMKTPVLDALSLTALVRVQERQNDYARLAGGGWVFAEHLAPLAAACEDAGEHIAANALRLRGMPYRWGGKEAVGLDCSALVQVALNLEGHACPRDSDMQAAAVGRTVEEDGEVEHGDLLYFPGHVAIALDEEYVVHATAHSMDVCVEALADVLERVVEESGRGVTAHRRL